MISAIVLDSGPLGLITQRVGIAKADACRDWLATHSDRGVRVVIPEIIDYELRRELLRANKAEGVERLDGLLVHPTVEFIQLDSAMLRYAASLWAISRQQGIPTADRHALDVDVILAAQAKSLKLDDGDFVIATTNLAHLARFVPAREWASI